MMRRNIFIDILRKLLFIIILIYFIYYCIIEKYTGNFRKIDISKIQATWLVVINDSKDNVFALAYGSLIHPKAVLTVGVVFINKSAQNYYAEKDCHLDINKEIKLFNCTRRTVSKIVYQDNESSLENTWALLILEKPFDITLTTAPISLIDDINAVDADLCFFTRWIQKDHIKINKNVHKTTDTRLILENYNTTFLNGQFDIHNFDIEHLRFHQEWIIGKMLDDPMTDNTKKISISLNFLGSSLTCVLKDNSEEFVQVGIAIFWIVIPISGLELEISQTRLLIKIIESYNQIITKLNENV